MRGAEGHRTTLRLMTTGAPGQLQPGPHGSQEEAWVIAPELEPECVC